MRRYLGLVLMLLPFSSPAFGFVAGAGLTVDQVMMWEGADTGYTHFKLSSGVWCYIPGDQKNLNSLVLMVYTSRAKVEVYCHDAADQSSGGSVPPAHRLHRIMAISN